MPDINISLKKAKQRKIMNQQGKKPAEKVLYETEHLKLTDHNSYFEINCPKDNLMEKKELIDFLRHAKKIFKENTNQKILVTLHTNWSINIDAWNMIVKMKFENINFIKIAFVTKSMHHALLFKHLEQTNFNIRVFSEKSTAIAWLRLELLNE